MGQGTYGIAAASLEYFDKSIKELNYSETALLAAYQKLQVNIILINFLMLAKYRRNLVLKNLEQNNFISKDQLNKFKRLKIKIKKRKIKNS